MFVDLMRMGRVQRGSVRSCGRLVSIVGWAVLLSATWPVDVCAAESSDSSAPTEARVGIFINSLYGLNLLEQSYEVVFWMWFLYDADSSYEPAIEIVNAKSADLLPGSYTKEVSFRGRPHNYTAMRYRATMIQEWDISNYPFDRQNLKIVIEDSELDYSELVYSADTANSRIDSSIWLSDWHIIDHDETGKRIGIHTGPKIYPTTWGDPSLQGRETSSYARATFTIMLERKGGRIFFNTFIGYYVAFLLTMLSYFVAHEELSAKFGLCSGAIFAAVGNKYVVDSSLPAGTSFLLNDTLQIATFLSIVITLAVSIATTRLLTRDCPGVAKRFNNYSFVSLASLYVVVNVYSLYVTMARGG